jgi:hypothetical protein
MLSASAIYSCSLRGRHPETEYIELNSIQLELELDLKYGAVHYLQA